MPRGFSVTGPNGGLIDGDYQNYAEVSSGTIRATESLGNSTDGYNELTVFGLGNQWIRLVHHGTVPFDRPYSTPPLVALRPEPGVHVSIGWYEQDSSGQFIGAKIIGDSAEYYRPPYPPIEYKVFVHTKFLPYPQDTHGIIVRDSNAEVSFTGEYNYLRVIDVVFDTPPTSIRYSAHTQLASSEYPYLIPLIVQGVSEGKLLGFSNATPSLVTFSYMNYSHLYILRGVDGTVAQLGTDVVAAFDFSVPQVSLLVVDPR